MTFEQDGAVVYEITDPGATTTAYDVPTSMVQLNSGSGTCTTTYNSIYDSIDVVGFGGGDINFAVASVVVPAGLDLGGSDVLW
jgi:hypothetical protein